MIALLSIFILIITSDAARILAIFPTPSISHQIVFRPITQELAKRGHEVIVITPDPAFAKEDQPKNLIEIDVHDISYKTWQEYLKTAVSEDGLTKAKLTIELFAKVTEAQMKDEEVKKIINSESKIDLLLVEACARMTLAFSHVFKSPVIQISSFGAMVGSNKQTGTPIHPILYPFVLSQKQYNLTIWEKLKELYSYFYIEKFYESYEQEENKMVKNIFGPDIPPLNELYFNVDMVFLNVDTTWADSQPVPQNVVYIGGIHQKPSKMLPKDLQLYFNSSQYDVIYVSFGTNLNSSQVPRHVIEAMIEVFSQLKYNILWKWNDKETKTPKNVKTYKWLPQMDILRHPKVKLFVTQGGLQSTQESILAGVPLVGIPIRADQWHNVEKYTYHKIGVKLELSVLTVQSLKKAILEVMEDESYQKNIINLRNIMHDQPQSPLERAICWTEYLLHHGQAKHLRAAGANKSWTEYYEIELIGMFMIVFLISLFILSLVVKFIIRYVEKYLFSYVKIKTY